jgi:hypothetical protein
MNHRSVLLWVIGLISLIGIAGGVVWRFLFVQPLSVRADGATVHADLRRLGEYYANVTRIRVVDATTEAIVWELEAAAGIAPVFTLALQRGSNLSNPGLGNSVRVVMPPTGAAFVLAHGRRYRLETWSTMEFGITSHRRATFVVP